MGELKDPQNNPGRESELQGFIAEITEMKRLDAERGWPVHLVEVDPSELTNEDMAIYESAKKRSITRKAFEDYKDKIVDKGRGGKAREEVSQSRVKFMEYIANFATPIFLREESRRT